MSFTDHKITQFPHRVADLPDEPQIPAADLKSRFDACPEELRQSLNAVCDDAARLEARVEGIVVDTFGDTIPKSMLSDELQDEIDAKATQTALAAETEARENLDDRVTANETLTAQKCEVYFGTYTGNGATSQAINLGFAPRAVYICTRGGVAGIASGSEYCYGGLAFEEHPLMLYSQNAAEITETGFKVYRPSDYFRINTSGTVYYYIAFH